MFLGFPSLFWVPLEACAFASCASAGGWLPAACKHTVLQEFAPETVAAAFMLFSWKGLNPQRRLCMGLPKVQMGQEDTSWSAAGSCKLAQGIVSLRNSAEPPLP